MVSAGHVPYASIVAITELQRDGSGKSGSWIFEAEAEGDTLMARL